MVHPARRRGLSLRRRLGFERALARSADIEVGSEPGWGLRVATRERHDVVLTGFASLAALGDAAQRARAAGFSPELIPLAGAAK